MNIKRYSTTYMQNISTNLTLFLKIFLPTFWLVFFGLFTIGSFTQEIYIGPFSPGTFRITCLLFFSIGLCFFYLTLMQLKRVDMDKEYMYVSNYFKTARYSYSAIEKIEERDFLLFHSVHVHFKKTGQFGKKIIFLNRNKKLTQFLTNYPEVAQQLINAIGRTRHESGKNK